LSFESLVAGALVVPLAGAVLPHRHGNGGVQSCRSRRTWHRSNRGFPGTWEVLLASLRNRSGSGDRNIAPQACGWASWTAGSETTGATQGIAGRRQPSPARGTQEVAQRRSTVEAGELASEDPVEGRVLPTGGPNGGNQGEHFVALVAVTVTPLDSLRGARPASAEVSRPRCQSVR
jgi:hypothetical protein